MRSNLIFVIGAVLFLGTAWFATNAPERSPFFTAKQASAGNAAGSALFSAGGGSNTNKLAGADAPLAALAKQLGDARAFGTPSSYRGIVTIEHNTAGVSQSSPQRQYIAIALSNKTSKDVVISGWTLESSATGLSATISQGVEVAKSGVVNTPTPIILHPGDRAILETGSSPIGVSFKENQCAGYLEQFQDFSPTLESVCPLPADDFASASGLTIKGGSACMSYLKTLPRCSIPTTFPSSVSDECRGYTQEHFTYNGCVDDHQSDKGFTGTTWRIFLSQDSQLWQSSHETIKLLDADGKTVDLFAY